MSAEILNAQHNDDTFENIWQELKWRGLVHVSTDEAALEKALSEESLTFYTGYDPTAASLHLGHLVQLLVMRRLQLAGHKPLGLVGGFTGLIGDPRQTSERVRTLLRLLLSGLSLCVLRLSVSCLSRAGERCSYGE